MCTTQLSDVFCLFDVALIYAVVPEAVSRGIVLVLAYSIQEEEEAGFFCPLSPRGHHSCLGPLYKEK